MPEACRVVIPALILQDVRVRSLVVGGELGSRDAGYPLPKVGTVSGGREKTQREELQCQVENDTAGLLVVKTVRILLVPSVGNGTAVRQQDCVRSA